VAKKEKQYKNKTETIETGKKIKVTSKKAKENK
jgi:hypothetical protein